MNWNFLIYALAIWRLAHMVVKEDGPGDVILRFRDWVRAGSRGWYYPTDAKKPWLPEWTGGLVNCVSCASVWAAALLWFVPGPIRAILAGSAIAKLVEDYFYAGVEDQGEDLVEIAPGEFMERSQVPQAFYEQSEE